ncbi:MAG: Asp23/Gls24 family envelope stress response protein [Synergistaceae bacterium]|nr:Asp23/Gls24 family envelope stress response protein [Synergistaceae bacterium]
MPDENNKSSEKFQLGDGQGGVIHVSEDVIVELAKKTIQGIANIKTAAKLSSKFALGRRSGGIRVDVDHNQGVISIDVYILVRYGQRIPDLAWDVQEKIKDNLERYTGYEVKAVNVNVQGIYTNGGGDLQIDLGPDDIFSPNYNEEAD